MDKILETNVAVETVRQAFDGAPDEQPRPEWVRGLCPCCGAPVVSNAYYVGGKGYLVVFECWESLRGTSGCTYRKVL